MQYLKLHRMFAPASLAVAGAVTALALFAAPAAQAQPQPPGMYGGMAPAYPGGPGYGGPGYGGPGYGGPGYGGPGPDRRGPVVRCESNNGRYRECRVPFRGQAELVRQLSDARCIPGRTYGTSRPGRIWVDRGCRGDFAPR